MVSADTETLDVIAIAIFRRAAFGASKHTCDKQQRLDIMLTSENRAVTKINDSHAARHKELYLRGGVIFRLERVPKEIENLTELRKLDLSCNSLESLPISLSLLTSLTELKAHSNQLRYIPDALARVQALKRLRLENNCLRSFPRALGRSLTDLTDLNLARNQISSPPFSFENLAGLKKLQRLNLSYNQITVIDSSIEELKELKVLVLSNNSIRAIPPEICQLSSLERLALSSNQLHMIPVEIGLLADLSSLKLRDNQLSILPKSLVELKNLKELNLDDNEKLNKFFGCGHSSELAKMSIMEVMNFLDSIDCQTSDSNEEQIDTLKRVFPRRSETDIKRALRNAPLMDHAVDLLLALDEEQIEQEKNRSLRWERSPSSSLPKNVPETRLSNQRKSSYRESLSPKITERVNVSSSPQRNGASPSASKPIVRLLREEKRPQTVDKNIHFLKRAMSFSIIGDKKGSQPEARPSSVANPRPRATTLKEAPARPPPFPPSHPKNCLNVEARTNLLLLALLRNETFSDLRVLLEKGKACIMAPPNISLAPIIAVSRTLLKAHMLVFNNENVDEFKTLLGVEGRISREEHRVVLEGVVRDGQLVEDDVQMHYIAEGDVVLGRGMKGSRISSGRPLSENREESGWNTAKPIAAVRNSSGAVNNRPMSDPLSMESVPQKDANGRIHEKLIDDEVVTGGNEVRIIIVGAPTVDVERWKDVEEIVGVADGEDEDTAQYDSTPVALRDYRAFLESLPSSKRKKTNQSFERFGKQWKRVATKPFSEQCRMLDDWIEKAVDQMLSHSYWKEPTRAELDNLQEAIRKGAFQQIFSRVFRTEADMEEDDELASKCRRLHFVTPVHLDLDPKFGDRTIWQESAEALRSWNDCYTPKEKLDQLLSCCKALYFILEKEGGEQGADAFLPLLIYVTIQSNPPDIMSNINFISRFAHARSGLAGEASYYFTNMLSVVTFIRNLKAEDLNIDPITFESQYCELDTYVTSFHEDDGEVDNRPESGYTSPQSPSRSPRSPHRPTRPAPGPPLLRDSAELTNAGDVFPFYYRDASDLKLSEIDLLLKQYKQLVHAVSKEKCVSAPFPVKLRLPSKAEVGCSSLFTRIYPEQPTQKAWRKAIAKRLCVEERIISSIIRLPDLALERDEDLILLPKDVEIEVVLSSSSFNTTPQAPRKASTPKIIDLPSPRQPSSVLPPPSPRREFSSALRRDEEKPPSSSMRDEDDVTEDGEAEDDIPPPLPPPLVLDQVNEECDFLTTY